MPQWVVRDVIRTHLRQCAQAPECDELVALQYKLFRRQSKDVGDNSLQRIDSKPQQFDAPGLRLKPLPTVSMEAFS
jgi:hypothetical protein